MSAVLPEHIPEHIKDNLARGLLEAARRFYDDPENVARFEAWKAKRDAERGEKQ